MTLVLYGPTVTGKTDLAISLAKKYSGELISADSRQVYTGLDIGSGKIHFTDTAEKHEGYWIVNGIRIRGFDIANPGTQFTVADFLKFVNSSIVQINKLSKLPIVVGGTGFYVRALIKGIDSIGIPADSKLRRKLEKLSVQHLYQKLLETNPQRAKSVNESDRQNPRRLIRAIEIALNNQKSTKKITTTLSNYPTSNYLLIGLTAPNEYLYKKADNWLNQRVESGLVNEVENLLSKGVNPGWLISLGLEYKWITKVVLGQKPESEAVECLKGEIHGFIRRQKTWFRQFPTMKIFDISKENWGEKLEKSVSNWYISCIIKKNGRVKLSA